MRNAWTRGDFDALWLCNSARRSRRLILNAMQPSLHSLFLTAFRSTVCGGYLSVSVHASSHLMMYAPCPTRLPVRFVRTRTRELHAAAERQAIQFLKLRQARRILNSESTRTNRPMRYYCSRLLASCRTCEADCAHCQHYYLASWRLD